MGDPQTAAIDPIFWVHHANVDRLWDVWLASGRSNPSDEAWRKNLVNNQPKPFVLFDESGAKVEVIAADFLPGGSRLDYQYDDLQGHSRLVLTDETVRRRFEDEHKRRMAAVQQLPAAQQKPIDDKRKIVFGEMQQPVQVTASENRIVLGATPVTVQALIPEDKRPRLKAAFELAKEDVVSPPRVVLHVEDVRSSGPPGVVFRVFLNQPKATISTDPDEANYVGSIALFQSSAHGHGELPGETFSFDITPLAQNLRERGKWDAEKIGVTLVAKGVGNKSTPRSEVTFKRVSMTIEPK
jgi:tyrosinase